MPMTMRTHPLDSTKTSNPTVTETKKTDGIGDATEEARAAVVSSALELLDGDGDLHGAFEGLESRCWVEAAKIGKEILSKILGEEVEEFSDYSLLMDAVAAEGSQSAMRAIAKGLGKTMNEIEEIYDRVFTEDLKKQKVSS